MAEGSQVPQTPMRVIGSGFGRTGTASLKRALEILGFGPCHHMEEVMAHSEDVPTWERASLGQPVDWKSFMGRWGSAVDFPSAFYYRQLMEAFPHAKVVHTTRDAASWYQSMSETIVPMMTRFPIPLVMPWVPKLGAPVRVMRHTSLRKELIGRFHDREKAMQMFTDRDEEVKKAVPADRLLVFQVKDGWEPLCTFLGVPVPTEPFPRVNDTATFKKNVVAATVTSWVILAVVVGAVFGLVRML